LQRSGELGHYDTAFANRFKWPSLIIALDRENGLFPALVQAWVLVTRIWGFG